MRPRPLPLSMLLLLGLAATHAHAANVIDLSVPHAQYSILIWTPQDPDGPTPQLSVQFTGSTSNGLAGVGWNVNAVSSIERCGGDPNEPTFSGPVLLSRGDRFCSSDVLLVLEDGSGGYGAPDSVYRAKSGGSTPVTARGVLGEGPKYFTSEMMNGETFEYGNTADSRVFLGTAPLISQTPLRWMLSKQIARNGNTLSVSYLNEGGFAIPDVIGWKSTIPGGNTYEYQVKFNYSNDRKDNDSFFTRIAGYPVWNRHRLETIQVKMHGVVRRTYFFSYDQSASKARTRLVEARDCYGDSGTSCSFPVSFRY